jgi:hypothetical protein
MMYKKLIKIYFHASSRVTVYDVEGQVRTLHLAETVGNLGLMLL